MFFKKKMINETFGKLVYKYDWRRDVTYELWGKTYNSELIIESFDEQKSITKIQEQAYKAFHNNMGQVEKTIKDYFLENYDEIIEDYYIAFGTSWALSANHRKQIQAIMDSHEREGKDAINDLLDNIRIDSVDVQQDGCIVIYFYVNIVDGHGLMLVIDSGMKVYLPEEYDDYCDETE